MGIIGPNLISLKEGKSRADLKSTRKAPPGHTVMGSGVEQSRSNFNSTNGHENRFGTFHSYSIDSAIVNLCKGGRTPLDAPLMSKVREACRICQWSEGKTRRLLPEFAPPADDHSFREQRCRQRRTAYN